MSAPLLHLTTYLDAQAQLKPNIPQRAGPMVTLSRQEGAQGELVAQRVSEILTKVNRHQRPWLVVDHALAERVMEDHNMPIRIARFLTEAQTSVVTDVLENLLGLHPQQWTLVEKMAQTILHLASIGNVIIVGRAANFITAHLETSFHVRVVGSIERRVERVMIMQRLDHSSAVEWVNKVDKDRAKFVAQHFKKNVEEVSAYDLVVNTDKIAIDAAAELVADQVIQREAALTKK